MDKQIKATASEIANLWVSHLWTAYQNNTLAICGLTHFLTHIDDQDIKRILEETKSLAEQKHSEIIALFNAEDYPIPKGFTKEDVKLDSPRLFFDALYLEYILNMTIISLSMYSMAIAGSDRDDVIQFFSSSLKSTKELHIRTKALLKEKGLSSKNPTIPTPRQVEFVKKDSFLSGWFGERRPLLGSEISNLLFHAQRNALGHALITGFSQVSPSKELRRFFERGRDISEKHLSVFTKLLHIDNLPQGSPLLTSEVTTSTTAPFSDKLMMYMVTNLINSSIGEYGISISTSPLHDLALQYTRLIAEISKYANDSANILIDKGWMEQPPIAADRKELAK
ncbi:transcriptional regulator [Oceanobacillus picturae]|uniref:Transcriptional regulator n=1 Tax=Oceanobacillus picturae TaxID=171693 RepID=A0A0U9HAR5_9BACI|nr:DUF3231 family protein [Oceanobacillus picturae]GAQ19515.1 transcriptional regulator [Oceanobacillus picturae]